MNKYKCIDCGKEITGRGKTRKCISCCQKGHKHSLKTINKLRKINIERYKDPKQRQKTGKSSIGRKVSKVTRDKMSKSNLGKKRTKKTRDRISKAKKGKTSSFKGKKHRPETIEKMSGKNNVNYVNGLGRFPYPIEFSSYLRKSIRIRDNNTCQNCGLTQQEHKKKYNKDIEIHHIDHCPDNCDKTNLITLCHKCNMEANTDRNYYYAFYTYKMENYIYV